MITKLVVSNYVLIDHLEVDFTTGFTTITGETGAGKSIILGALSLLLGERAESSAKKSLDKKVTAEGTFNLKGYQLEPFFESNDLDYDETFTTLRREILPSGKSRAFINDTPVKAAVLKELGTQLVDIHSQHENQQLLKPEYQLRFLDAYAGHESKVAAYYQSFREFQQLNKQLEERKNAHAEAVQKADYLAFQLQEMEEANIENIQFQELKSSFEVLENADEIREGIQGGLSAVSENEVNAISLIKNALSSVTSISDISADFQELASRLQSVDIELDDIRLELEGLASNVEADPNKLMELKTQLDDVNRLLFKHQLTEFEELLQLKETLQNDLNGITNADDEIAELEQKVENQRLQLVQFADKLHATREKAQLDLAQNINSHLARLGMPNAAVGFDLSRSETLLNNGNTKIKVMFSANKGFKADGLEKVASGGERSRLMLVLKKIHAEVAQTPTLILDEIDTGISGEVAAKTANMLAEMTSNSQIVSITHLPQVAAKANSHYLVAKHVEGETTVTGLRQLSTEERTREIARMLSGENITEAALDNAHQLMS